MRVHDRARRMLAALAVVALLGGCDVTPTPSASPAPTPSPARTASPVPTPASADLSWSEVALSPDAFDGAVVMRVVAGPGLVVAFGRDRLTLDPVVWTSPDGRSWTRRSEPPDVFGGGVPDAAVVTARGVIALGWGPDPASGRREIWTSPDGIAWTRDPSASARLGRGELSFTAHGDTVVAAGTIGSSGVFLRSTDLVHWVDLSESPVVDPDRGSLIVSTGSGFVGLTTGEQRLTAWSSQDALAWTETGSIPYAWAGVAASTADGLVMLGDDNATGTTTGSAWWSPDGRSWQAVPDLSDGAMRDFRSTLLAIDGGVVGLAVAAEPAADGTAAMPVVVASRDLRTWQRLPFPQPDLVVTSWRDLAVAVDGHVLVLGWDAVAGRVRGWEGSFATAPAGGPSPAATPGASSVGSPSSGAATGMTLPVDRTLNWRPVDATAVFDGGLVSPNLAVLGGSLVAVARRGSLLHAWVSADEGLHWVEAPGQAAFQGGTVADVVAVGSRLIAVGSVDGPDDTLLPASWTTADGLSWKRTLAPGGPGAMTAVGARGDTFVAVGRAGEDGGEPASWISRDGDRWTLAAGAWTPEGGTVAVLAPGGPGWVAGGADDLTPMIWTSADGVTWAEVADPSAFQVEGIESYGQGAITGLATVPGGFVAVGTVAVGGPMVESRGAVFTSPDGLAWTRLADDDRIAAEWPAAVATSGAGVAFVGAGRMGEGGAWVSSDGTRWTAADGLDMTGAGSDVRLGFWDVVGEGDGFAALGTRDGRPTLWFAVPAGTTLPQATCATPPATLAALAAMPEADRVACLTGVAVSVDAWARYWPAQGGSVPPVPIYPGLTLSSVEGGRILLDVALGPGSPARTVEPGGRFRLRLAFGRVDEGCVPAPDPASPYVQWSEPAAWLRFACAAEPRLIAATPLP